MRSINTAISQIFSALLAVISATVVLIAILAMLFGNAKAIPFVLLALVGYIFLVGLTCTLLSMREYLAKLVQK